MKLDLSPDQLAVLQISLIDRINRCEREARELEDLKKQFGDIPYAEAIRQWNGNRVLAENLLDYVKKSMSQREAA